MQREYGLCKMDAWVSPASSVGYLLYKMALFLPILQDLAQVSIQLFFLRRSAELELFIELADGIDAKIGRIVLRLRGTLAAVCIGIKSVVPARSNIMHLLAFAALQLWASAFRIN